MKVFVGVILTLISVTSFADDMISEGSLGPSSETTTKVTKRIISSSRVQQSIPFHIVLGDDKAESICQATPIRLGDKCTFVSAARCFKKNGGDLKGGQSIEAYAMNGNEKTELDVEVHPSYDSTKTILESSSNDIAIFSMTGNFCKFTKTRFRSTPLCAASANGDTAISVANQTSQPTKTVYKTSVLISKMEFEGQGLRDEDAGAAVFTETSQGRCISGIVSQRLEEPSRIVSSEKGKEVRSEREAYSKSGIVAGSRAIKWVASAVFGK